jgi:hypothetical protein
MFFFFFFLKHNGKGIIFVHLAQAQVEFRCNLSAG